MNDLIKNLVEKARKECSTSENYTEEKFIQKFAELIINEHLTLLKREWYKLNNIVVDTESSRDTGMRVGRKTEIISLLAKIKQHWSLE